MARALALCQVSEVGGRFGSSVPPVLIKVNAAASTAETGGMSPVWNASTFRRSFPAAWGEYLRQNYRTAYAVERAFGVDSHTARDWWNGKRDPSGSFVAAVVARDPQAMNILGRTA